jgi:2-polyprenyl-3-methyl-5-hydroxy-6-metoxy-1,4-benzoquinol methylase
MNNAAKAIIRELERVTAIGSGQSQVFDDWLEITHAALQRLPDHLRAARLGEPLTDTPETVKLWERLNVRYNRPYCWEHFSKAFAVLLESADIFDDTIGRVYMDWGIPNKYTGQFFTPFSVARMMARLTTGPEMVYQRLQAAYEQSSYGAIHKLLAPDRISDFVHRLGPDLVPLCAEFIQPLTICDPCCGSGVMLLAAAEVFDRWMLDWGLVQFYGMDIDRTCVMMAQINVMLYGLNSYSLKCALELSQAELQAIPEPWQTKYTEAQAQPERVDEILAEVRSWQQPALF